jgi:hypothetical protein
MLSKHQEYADQWGERARLALDTLQLKPTKGIPGWVLHTLDHSFMEDFVGRPRGDYRKDPVGVYLAMQHKAGTCFIDQWIPDNPLTMGEHGYESDTQRTSTTGLEKIVRDGMEINSPEAVAEHMEKFLFPQYRQRTARLRAEFEQRVGQVIAEESAVQKLFGPNLLKGPYDPYKFWFFPLINYGIYGYENYFMAYALYPELMEQDMKLQGDLGEVWCSIGAAAITRGELPPMVRLDHDMCDGRGPLVSVESLERIWWPHFARSIKPLLDAGVRCIWHCDGNQMPMIPMLLEAGIGGFQGFQYEFGMDYERICRMKDRNGNPLFIIGGASVTQTLPRGSPRDVRDELRWLVEKGPKAGLMLGASSSILPGTPHENLRAFVEGLRHYRENGRASVR